MTDPLFSDNAFQASKIALDGLSRRQETIARNLANVDTPGFRSETVSFEGALQKAIGKTDTLSMQTTNAGHMAAPSEEMQMQISEREGGSSRADGNDVDIDVELNQLSDTRLRYMALTQLINKKYSIMKNITVSR